MTGFDECRHVGARAADPHASSRWRPRSPRSRTHSSRSPRNAVCAPRVVTRPVSIRATLPSGDGAHGRLQALADRSRQRSHRRCRTGRSRGSRRCRSGRWRPGRPCRHRRCTRRRSPRHPRRDGRVPRDPPRIRRARLMLDRRLRAGDGRPCRPPCPPSRGPRSGWRRRPSAAWPRRTSSRPAGAGKRRASGGRPCGAGSGMPAAPATLPYFVQPLWIKDCPVVSARAASAARASAWSGFSTARLVRRAATASERSPATSSLCADVMTLAWVASNPWSRMVSARANLASVLAASSSCPARVSRSAEVTPGSVPLVIAAIAGASGAATCGATAPWSCATDESAGSRLAFHVWIAACLVRHVGRRRILRCGSCRGLPTPTSTRTQGTRRR